jgi:hypothetical protein
MSDFNRTNAGLVILSVLLPIVGYVLFFVKREKEPDAARNYLWSAVAGSVVGVLLALG